MQTTAGPEPGKYLFIVFLHQFSFKFTRTIQHHNGYHVANVANHVRYLDGI